MNRRKSTKIRALPVVMSTSENRPLVGDSVKVLPNNSKRASVTENVFDQEA